MNKAIRSEEMLKALRNLTVSEIAQELDELRGLKKEWAEKVGKLKKMLGTRFDKLVRELHEGIDAEIKRVEKNAYLKGWRAGRKEKKNSEYDTIRK